MDTLTQSTFSRPKPRSGLTLMAMVMVTILKVSKAMVALKSPENRQHPAAVGEVEDGVAVRHATIALAHGDVHVADADVHIEVRACVHVVAPSQDDPSVAIVWECQAVEVLQHDEAQREYAASDVRYLHRLRDELVIRLEREGRMDMAQACFDFLPTRAALDIAGWDGRDIFSHNEGYYA